MKGCPNGRVWLSTIFKTSGSEKRVKTKRERMLSSSVPKLKLKELSRALLQMTMETEEMTERLRAPTVPS